MKMQLTPCKGHAVVQAPASKSFVHRLLICAALATAPSRLTIADTSDDIEATAQSLTALGTTIEKDGANWTVTPPTRWQDNALLDCGESGSTLRFLLPVVSALGLTATFTGRGKLPERPNEPLLCAMRDHGVSAEPRFPIRISGKLTPGRYSIRGDVSSQYITGLLLALPLLDAPSEIQVLPPLESAPYLDITCAVLRQCGANIRQDGLTYTVFPAALQGGNFAAESDWSNAAALLACGMSVKGLNLQSVQGDRAFLDVAAALGATVMMENDGMRLDLNALHGTLIDASPIPDLVPVLAALAATAAGTTRIYNAQRLRLKESDRLQSTAAALCALGADVRETDDGLLIEGKPALAGGTASSANDHRIVMAAAVAAQKCKAPVVIEDAQAIHKSFPTFFNLYRTNGGDANVL